ncbi:putative ferric-chelate reductase 1 [Archocentrus centrarchus]|uniref:putative ferric-chelate reductase 1 n=1 Tax=Archocentrus centrarchus TaxID=63155 RepID=UPI0011EA060B|nr:putative ferric-chelate reductase 1 [Archocentrus centrarchus]
MSRLESDGFFAADLVVLLLVCTGPLVRGFPSGLVTDSCGDMRPRHSGATPQTAPSPFTVTTGQRSYSLGEDVKVELLGPASTPFTGFLLEAREVGSQTPVGSFAIPAGGAQILTCSQNPNSAVSHSSGFTSSYIQVTWRSEPSRDMKSIQFRASFVQNFRTFWVDVMSPVLTFSNDSAVGPAGALSASRSTGTPTHNTANGNIQPARVARSARAGSAGSISSADCGVTKVCFSQPPRCDPAVDANCYFMSAMMLPGGAAVHYEMSGPVEGYVAFGFSDDQNMGNDDIYICGTESNGAVRVQHAFSSGRSAPQILTAANVYNITTSNQNSVISCSFTSTNTISTQRTSGFNQTYYLLFAHGSSRNGQIQFHSGTFVSTDKIDISHPAVIGKNAFPPIIKAHGSLMLIAWMTTGSLGMMVARYLKKMAKGEKLCNKDVWFVVHVGAMIVTVVATSIAFILVFSYAQDWAGGAHPVLGCLVMILSLIQPIGAMLRCGPQHHLRYLFNWSHFLNAVVIKAIAVAAIFTGLDLIDSTNAWLMKVMGGFLGWEALFYIMLEVHDWKIKHTESTPAQLESALVKGDGLLIALFFLGNFCFLVALLVGIGMS